MTAAELSEALRLAKREVAETHMLTYGEYRKLARAIIALAAERDATAKVVHAALAWREGRDRNIIGTAPPGGRRSATGVALIDAVDAYRQVQR